MTDAQLRLRGTRSGHDVQSGRTVVHGAEPGRDRCRGCGSESLHEWGLTPLAEGIGCCSLDLPMVAVPDSHQRRGRGVQHLGVKHPNIVYRQRCNGLLAANRSVTVRMLTVKEPQECAIGDGSW